MGSGSNNPMEKQERPIRLGCLAEGRIRRHIFMNGNYYDELIFGLTREEFDDLELRLKTESSNTK